MPALSESQDLSLELVARAGNRCWMRNEDVDLDLIGAMLAVEQQIREQQFAAVERMLPFIDSTSGAVLPDDNAALHRFVLDLRIAGWWEDAPEPGGEPVEQHL